MLSWTDISDRLDPVRTSSNLGFPPRSVHFAALLIIRGSMHEFSGNVVEEGGKSFLKPMCTHPTDLISQSSFLDQMQPVVIPSAWLVLTSRVHLHDLCSKWSERLVLRSSSRIQVHFHFLSFGLSFESHNSMHSFKFFIHLTHFYTQQLQYTFHIAWRKLA